MIGRTTAESRRTATGARILNSTTDCRVAIDTTYRTSCFKSISAPGLSLSVFLDSSHRSLSCVAYPNRVFPVLSIRMGGITIKLTGLQRPAIGRFLAGSGGYPARCKRSPERAAVAPGRTRCGALAASGRDCVSRVVGLPAWRVSD